MAENTGSTDPVLEAQIENLHVRELLPLITPEDVKVTYPATDKSISVVRAGREAIRSMLEGPDTANKLAVVVGPCSVHDPEAALEYATWLMEQREQHGDQLELLMRVYFEKPRTTIGWKGLINDPHLDKSYDINGGLLLARKLVSDITNLGVPVATELLDTTTPQYFAGLISWGAIGARTTESQLHRELASGLSFPVGFKNGTSGNTRIAVDAVEAARHPHHFPAITDEGKAAIAATKGNPDCHIILRGGTKVTNYDEGSVQAAVEQLTESGLAPLVMVDFSHANSGKDYTKQRVVAGDVASQISRGSTAIMGVMIESNLVEGAQPFNPGGPHEYGKSITDGCIGLDETADVLKLLHGAVAARQQTQAVL